MNAWIASLDARLHAFALDHELASGIAPWRSLLPLLTMAGRLRSEDPVDARGVARPKILLSDGSGPCYVRIRRNALADALHEISQWLAVPQ
jgi:hypothetical protein